MRSIILLSFIALSGCATTGAIVNCENAEKLRQAAVTAIAAIDYACPIIQPSPIEAE